MATLALPTSPTHFACEVAGIIPSAPPADRKGNVQYGDHAVCWLCGGDTDGHGWPAEKAISPTFTQHNLAATQDSDTVCAHCVALTKAATFQDMVRRLGLDLKIWTQAGWHSYSHLFIAPNVYEAPKPSRVRELLLNPPEQPFLLCINASGQKHTVFRGRVALGREFIPVHFDDVTFDLDRSLFTEVLRDFEAMTAEGFSKDSVLTGRYHPEAVRAAGISKWKPLDDAMRRWRSEQPLVLSLAHWCARSSSFFKDSSKGETES